MYFADSYTATDYAALSHFLLTGNSPNPQVSGLDDRSVCLQQNDEVVRTRLLERKQKRGYGRVSDIALPDEFELYCARELTTQSGALIALHGTKDAQFRFGDSDLLEFKNDMRSIYTGNFYVELYEKKFEEKSTWTKSSALKLGQNGEYAPYFCIGTEQLAFILHKDVLHRGLMTDIEKSWYRPIPTAQGFAIPKRRLVDWVLASSDDEPCAILELGSIITRSDLAEELAINSPTGYVEETIRSVRARQSAAGAFLGADYSSGFHAAPDFTTMPGMYCYDYIKNTFLSPVLVPEVTPTQK